MSLLVQLHHLPARGHDLTSRYDITRHTHVLLEIPYLFHLATSHSGGSSAGRRFVICEDNVQLPEAWGGSSLV